MYVRIMWLHDTSRYFPFLSSEHLVRHVLRIVPLDFLLILLLIVLLLLLALINLSLAFDENLARLPRVLLPHL